MGEKKNNNYKKFQKYNVIIGVILGIFPLFIMIFGYSFFELLSMQLFPFIVLISLSGFMIGAIQGDKKLKQHSKSIFPFLLFFTYYRINTLFNFIFSF